MCFHSIKTKVKPCCVRSSMGVLNVFFTASVVVLLPCILTRIVWSFDRRDIADALAQPLERAGIERGARAGYPIGLSYPPDWGERTISIRTEDKSILHPGMTFHFMPGLWMPNWGLEITESILIRETGAAETLCNRPRELMIK